MKKNPVLICYREILIHAVSGKHPEVISEHIQKEREQGLLIRVD